MMQDTRTAAVGKWRSILASLGVEERFLSGKHCPCPICGGKDRFRFDDKEGRGTWICSVCGAGDGFKLLFELKGWPFKEAAREVDQVVGSANYQKPRVGLSEDDRKRNLRELWKASQPVQKGDPVDVYLTARGVGLDAYPKCLRTVQKARTSCGKHYPMMMAMVEGADGPVTIHRTWLDGEHKAPVESPRKMMPGTLPDNVAVRLMPPTEEMGVAEGIETALAAARLTNMPVWSCINANLLIKFRPPEGVKRVLIFGDNDRKYAGQAAAYTLAHRLICRGIEVAIRLPDQVGKDWNDVLVAA